MEFANETGRPARRVVRPSKVARLSATARRVLVQSAVCNPKVMAAAVAAIKPEDFTEEAPALGYIYLAAKTYFTEYGNVPSRQMLLTGLGKIRAQDPEAFDADVVGDIRKALSGAFGQNRDQFLTPHAEAAALDLVRRFAQETAVVRLAEVVQDLSRLPADIPRFIREHLDSVEAAASVGVSSANDLFFEDGWDDLPLFVRRSTGSDLLDRFTGGGMAGGWQAVFLAPMGSCKTTLAVHSVTVLAEQARMLHESTGGRRPMVFLFTTETPRQELQQRALAAAALIDKSMLVESRPLANLPEDSEPPSADEQLFFRDQIEIGCYLPPRQRAIRALETLNAHAHIADFSGTSKDLKMRRAGVNGVPDIEAYMNDYLRSNPDVYPYAIWFDHLSAFERRIVKFQHLDPNDHHRVLAELPDEMRLRIAIPFDVPIVIAHQLTGSANAYGPGAELRMTDGRGSKMLAEFVDFAILAGMPSGDDHVCRVFCDKRRHQPPMPPRFARIWGGYGRVTDVSETYTMSPSGRSIVRRDESHDGGTVPPPGGAYAPGGY